jgi:ABC-2 type transport system ATP-binding protein
MTTSSTGLVEAEDLRKTYKSDVRALDGLTFSVAPGSVYALLGPNGAGKTTTVRILTTLSRPDAGNARVAGIDVLRHPARVRSLIGAVSQHSGAVDQLTGQENLSIQGGLYGIRGKDLRRRVTELLDQFGLAAAAKRQARTYSGGMRRRLDIATVLVHRPAVLFLDEPTTGLDPEGRAALWTVLTDLAAEAGTTILVTTHYLDEADQYATKIAIVDQGRVVAEGTADQLKAGLAGDSVLLELYTASHAERVTAVLSQIPEVTRASANGCVVRARVADGPRALPAVLAGVESAGVPVLSVSVARPTLDDVYLHHAGRSFRQAERI